MKTLQEVKNILISEIPERFITDSVVENLTKKLNIYVVTNEQKNSFDRNDICRYCGSLHIYCICD
jgi:ethanolamine utilization protein EutQ (cupin superfamily)